MKLFLKKLPLPICGLILGIASLGICLKQLACPSSGMLGHLVTCVDFTGDCKDWHSF